LFSILFLNFMTKIYVGGLPYQTDDAQLEQIFSSYGEIASARVINDRDTGRSKGFGFVEMNDDEAAKKAISELNEADLGGRTITVNEARPMEQRSGGGGGYRGGGGGGGNRGGGGYGGGGGRSGGGGGKRW
jgi:cold-inducible RNA-binding protein